MALLFNAEAYNNAIKAKKKYEQLLQDKFALETEINDVYNEYIKYFELYLESLQTTSTLKAQKKSRKFEAEIL